MKRFLWATPLLFVLISSVARADSVNISFGPNSGSGDNFRIEQQSGGTTVILGGGTPFGFFDDIGYAAGSTLGGFTTVYLDYGSAQIGGDYYDLTVGTGTLFMSSLTLPTNGASTVTVPVTLSFAGSGTTDTGAIFSAAGSATGTITFVQVGGLYYGGAFTATPEPGTLGLIATGLIGIFWVARRRLGISAQLGPTRILSKRSTW